MSKLNVSFYQKNDKQRNGESAIYAKIKLGNTTSTMSTGKYLSSVRWKKTNMLLNAKRGGSELSLKNYIYEIPRNILDIYFRLSKETKNITARDLKNAYSGKTNNGVKITIIQLLNSYVTHFEKRVEKGDVSIRTLLKYEGVVKIFKEFLNKKYKLIDFPFEDIDSQFVYSFDDYLRFEKPNGVKLGIGNNTTIKYISNIKSFLNFSVKRSVIKYNPFSIYETKLNDVDTVFLSQVELDRIGALKFESYRLDTVRDIFLFSCYTSYAPIDSMSLTTDNLEIDASGSCWIRTKRQKSGVQSDIVALPPVLKIVEKYKQDPRCINTGKLLPNYSNQKMNEYLKEIAALAGIKKRLTWYVSRHTFATTVCLSNKIPLEVVSRMMGHKKITQTQHYAKLVDNRIIEETNKLKEIYSE
jgi:site-specific recombinase XerD